MSSTHPISHNIEFTIALCNVFVVTPGRHGHVGDTAHQGRDGTGIHVFT